MIESALAPSLSFAKEVHRFFEGLIPNSSILRLRAGDTVIYHPLKGGTKTFILGEALGQGENGKVFVLAGTHPSEAIKFFTERNPEFAAQEISSFQLLEKQGIPHARVREYDTGFYLIRDEIKGLTLHELTENVPKLPRPERTRYLITLQHAVEHFQTLLQKGPYGFEELHAGNVVFDGKILHVIDVGKWTHHPQETANEFQKTIDQLAYVGPSLRVLREDPKWLECYYDLQDALWKPFLDTEDPNAIKLREAFRLRRPVPVAIQEEIAAAAVRESSSPLFHEKIEPMLNSILSRGELKGPSLRTLTYLLSTRNKSPAASECLLEQVGSSLQRPLTK